MTDLAQPILLAILAAFLLGPMAWRFLTPIPRKDVEAIGAFLGVIGQKPERITRLVVGGPWDRSGRIPTQTGRPYRVLAREADYGLRTHVLAIDGVDGDGRPHVRERVGGVWSRDPRVGSWR